MRIVVVGAGGVGAVFGTRLAAAGADVAYLARGRHLEAMRREGLRVIEDGRVVADGPVTAAEAPAQLGRADVVLLTVKLWDLAPASHAVGPLVGSDTLVVTLQNGVDAAGIVRALMPGTTVLSGVAHVAARIAAPGVVHKTGALQRFMLGREDGKSGDRLEKLDSLIRASGLEGGVTDRIGLALWQKFVFLATVSAVTAATRLPIGLVRQVPETRRLLERGAGEVAALGRARGIPLSPDTVPRIVAAIDALDPAMRTSMQQDLESGGRLELPWLSGAVVRMAAEAGVPVPVHEALLGILAPYVDGRPVAA
jgi:2-dehydropantoate 2-reductase